MLAQFEISPRLRERRDEIVAAVQSRIEAIEGSERVDDLTYQDGLRRAVVAAVDFGLEALESTTPPSHPPELFSQVRLAARHNVPFATVVHRYVAGNQILGDYLVEVARDQRLPLDALQDLFRRQACAFEEIISTLGAEYTREVEIRGRSLKDRRLALVRRLLDGERIDTAPLRFNIDGWNLALIGSGDGAGAKIRDRAARFDRQLLLVEPSPDCVWAWLGGRRDFSKEEIDGLLAAPPVERCAIGEPFRGPDGWRFSHHQAVAAMAVANRRGGPVRYSEVVLEAAVLRDDVLATSLRTLWLEPLRQDERGAALIDTIRAYLKAERNASSAAAGLGITRQTLRNRLKAAEELLGTPMGRCATELELTLRSEDLIAETLQPASTPDPAEPGRGSFGD